MVSLRALGTAGYHSRKGFACAGSVSEAIEKDGRERDWAGNELADSTALKHGVTRRDTNDLRFFTKPNWHRAAEDVVGFWRD